MLVMLLGSLLDLSASSFTVVFSVVLVSACHFVCYLEVVPDAVIGLVFSTLVLSGFCPIVYVSTSGGYSGFPGENSFLIPGSAAPDIITVQSYVDLRPK